MSLLRQPIEKTCEVCRTAFETRNSGKLCCSRSCSVTLSWRNPQAKERRSIGIRHALASDAGKARVARTNQARWANPEARERLAEWNRQRWRDPKIKAELSAAIRDRARTPERRQESSLIMQERWLTPDGRERMVQGIRKSKQTPEARAKFSELLRARWADGKWRAIYSRANWKRAQDPALRAATAERMKAVWNDPVFREQALARLQGMDRKKGWQTRQSNFMAKLQDCADRFGCVAIEPERMAVPLTVNLLQALEDRGWIMLAKPAARDGSSPAIYQLLKAPDEDSLTIEDTAA